MVESSFVLLHGGHGQEVTLLTYVYRIFLYLLAVGGLGVLVFWWLDAVEAVRSALPARGGRKENDR